MRKVIKKALISVALIASSIPVLGQNLPYTNVCTSGASNAITSGLRSSNLLQSAYTYCLVTVYNTGTTTKATIYSNSSGTALSNPFYASATTGQYTFYAANGSVVDVTMSGGNPSPGIVTPYTITGVSIGSSGGGGGGTGTSTPGQILVNSSGSVGGVTGDPDLYQSPEGDLESTGVGTSIVGSNQWGDSNSAGAGMPSGLSWAQLICSSLNLQANNCSNSNGISINVPGDNSADFSDRAWAAASPTDGPNPLNVVQYSTNNLKTEGNVTPPSTHKISYTSQMASGIEHLGMSINDKFLAAAQTVTQSGTSVIAGCTGSVAICITGNVATVTVANAFSVGQRLTPSGCTTETAFNSLGYVQLTAATPTTISFPFSNLYAQVSVASDTCTFTPSNPFALSGTWVTSDAFASISYTSGASQGTGYQVGNLLTLSCTGQNAIYKVINVSSSTTTLVVSTTVSGGVVQSATLVSSTGIFNNGQYLVISGGGNNAIIQVTTVGYVPTSVALVSGQGGTGYTASSSAATMISGSLTTGSLTQTQIGAGCPASTTYSLTMNCTVASPSTACGQYALFKNLIGPQIEQTSSNGSMTLNNVYVPATGKVFVWYMVGPTFGGSFTLTADGGSALVDSFTGNSTIAEAYQGTDSYAYAPANWGANTVQLAQFTVTGGTTHSFTITGINSGNTTGIVGIGIPPATRMTGTAGPNAFVGGAIPEGNNSQPTCGVANPPGCVSVYSGWLQALVDNLGTSTGTRVKYFSNSNIDGISDFYNTNPINGLTQNRIANSTNGLHMDSTGHAKLAANALAAIKAVPATPATVQATGGLVTYLQAQSGYQAGMLFAGQFNGGVQTGSTYLTRQAAYSQSMIPFSPCSYVAVPNQDPTVNPSSLNCRFEFVNTSPVLDYFNTLEEGVATSSTNYNSAYFSMQNSIWNQGISLTQTPGTGYTGTPVLVFSGGTCTSQPTGYAFLNAGGIIAKLLTSGVCTVAPTPSVTGVSCSSGCGFNISASLGASANPFTWLVNTGTIGSTTSVTPVYRIQPNGSGFAAQPPEVLMQGQPGDGFAFKFNNANPYVFTFDDSQLAQSYGIQVPSNPPSGSNNYLSCSSTPPYACSWAAGGSGGVTFPTGLLYGTGTTSAPLVATQAQVQSALGTITNSQLASPTITVNGTPCTLGASCSPSNATTGTAIPTAAATSPATYYQTGVVVGNATVTDTWQISPNGYNWVNLRTGAVSRANSSAVGVTQYVGTTKAHYAFADGLGSSTCADSSSNAYNLDCSHITGWSAPISTVAINNGGSGWLPGQTVTFVQSGASGGTGTVTGVINTGSCVTSTGTSGAICSISLTNAGSNYVNATGISGTGSGTGATFNITAALGISIANQSSAYVKLPVSAGLIGGGVGEIVCGTFPNLGGVFGTNYAQAMLSASYDTSVGAWSANTTFTAGSVYINAGTWYSVTTTYTSGATFGSTDTANTTTTTAPTTSASRVYGLLGRGGYIASGFQAGNGASNEPILVGGVGTTESPFTIPASTPSCLGFYSDGSNLALNQLYSGYQQAPSYAVKQTFPTTTMTQATLGNLRSDGLNNSYTPGATYYLYHSFTPVSSGPSLTEQMQANLAQAAQELLVNKGVTVTPSFLGANNAAPLLDCSGSSIVVGFNSIVANTYALGACGYVMKQLGSAPQVGSTVGINGLGINVVDHGVGSAAYQTASTTNSILNVQLPGITNLKTFYGVPGAQCAVFIDGPTNDIKAYSATGAVAWASYQQAAATVHAQGCRVIGATMVNRNDCTGTCATNQAAFNTLMRANWQQDFDAFLDLAADPRFANAAPEPTSTGAWQASHAYTAGQAFTYTPTGGSNTSYTVVTGYTSGATWQGCQVSSTGADCVDTAVNPFSDGVHWSDYVDRNGGGYELAGQYILSALTKMGFVQRSTGPYIPANSATPVFDCSQGLNVYTLTAAITPSFTNFGPGQTCQIELIENSTGGYNWTLPTFSASTGGGVSPNVTNAPTLTTTANAVNFVSLTLDAYGTLNATVSGSSPVSSSGGTITAVTVTSPIGGGGTSGSVNVNCPTCATAAASLAANAIVTGAGSQGLQGTALTGYLYGNGSSAPTASTTIPYANLSGTVPTWNQNTTGSAGSVANALTANNSGTGAASGTTYNGSAPVTVSYNTLGAANSGANSNITSLSGLTTPLSATQGGTGVNTSALTGCPSVTAGTWGVGNCATAIGLGNNVVQGPLYVFGDSIGAGLVATSSNASAATTFAETLPGLLARAALHPNGPPGTNVSVAGTTAETINAAVFNNFVAPNNNGLIPHVLIETGVNDANISSGAPSAPYSNEYTSANQAMVIHTAVPPSYQFGASTATNAGGTFAPNTAFCGWHSSFNGTDEQVSASGATFTFSVTTTVANQKVGVMWCGSGVSSGGQFTVGGSVFGGTLQTALCSGTTTFYAYGCNSSTGQERYAQEFASVATPGTYNLVVTTTNASAVDILGIYVIPPSGTAPSAVVTLSDVPIPYNTQAAGPTTAAASFSALNAAVVTAEGASGNGLPVTFANLRTGAYVINNTTDYVNNSACSYNQGLAPLHPNCQGVVKWVNSIISNAGAISGVPVYWAGLGEIQPSDYPVLGNNGGTNWQKLIHNGIVAPDYTPIAQPSFIGFSRFNGALGNGQFGSSSKWAPGILLGDNGGAFSQGLAPYVNYSTAYSTNLPLGLISHGGWAGIDCPITATSPAGCAAYPWYINPTGFANFQGVSGGEETVTFSATPTFSATLASSVITLTANITSWTLAAGTAGASKTLTFCQNATGGFTVAAAPSTVRGFFTPGTTANLCSSQHFVYHTAVSAWVADSSGVINE